MTETAELEQLIRKYALLNAIHHDGKAEIEPVIGKLLAEHPALRQVVKEIPPHVIKIVKEVNTLSIVEQKRELERSWPEAQIEERAKPEAKILPPLRNIEKYEKVITRFSPNPDCVLHLGTARAIILSHEYARRYKGDFYLRLEDTDPKTKKPVLEFYDAIREDLAWLGCRVDAEFIQSDRIPIYYDYAEKLLGDGYAYICTCNPIKFRTFIIKGRPCLCRNLPPQEQLARWEKMLDGTFREGKAVVRIKTELNHPNPAVRDWPALRIIDTQRYPHPRSGAKYRVWPLYNLACGLDDHLLGITHIIRGKEHLTNEERQRYLYKYFGWDYPETIHYGRLKVTGAVLSKSKIKAGVEDGLFGGYDDPRLATFKALRRRGITPEAIRKMMIDIGPKTVDVIISWENLYAYNRKILDPTANRYFFVESPIPLTVAHVAKTYKPKIPLHPSYRERGNRTFNIKPVKNIASFFISSNDLKRLKRGKVIRLMELFNITTQKATKRGVEAVFHSEAYSEARRLGASLIHWLPTSTHLKTRVVMPNASVVKGYAEDGCRKLEPGTLIQFERFGFVRIDQAGEPLTAYYAHL